MFAKFPRKFGSGGGQSLGGQISWDTGTPMFFGVPVWIPQNFQDCCFQPESKVCLVAFLSENVSYSRWEIILLHNSMLDLRSETVDEMAQNWRSISLSILAWSDCSVELEDFLDFEERCIESCE
jgi:hypothetical protein